ncbi:class I SAM-dependent methyltransferase [Erythrobacter sp. HL-111]|uniref:class I SAM-dependent methyltransferase n=1 Tax=Erythrobacter sp. HL-111 TaxID=1798193 RepID=UPI0006DA63A2|nr:class I SAM-dependent methyltransferase [Erythrobacter sp. HL-111]KPP94971.1 MAG: cyclopropane-fatty-acyl-phospholipid synthase [Erythrobacteraceae bacterium HL-111]SDS14156.1 cyclopropane-fatty-acyl-phospholipid synthase [Erythrobacter sp. HL-111]
MSKALLDRFLTRAVERGRLGVVFADGEARVYGEQAEGFPDIVIRFTDDAVPRDIVFDPRLGAAEAFMDRRLVIEEGDVMGLVGLLRMNGRWERGGDRLRPSLPKRLVNTAAVALDRFNDAVRAQRNVAHHYDIGNALYALMLDPEHFQYSCAYWNEDHFGPGMTLGQAQEAKLAHIAAKLAIRPGQKVLDIGCGWGGMAIYLARKYDVEVTGITLSSEQAALARKRIADAGVAGQVTIELVDYRDFAASGQTFDRIVSVGMFEHVGQAQFDTFFECCARMLDPMGVMLIHTIGRMGSPGATDAFTRKYIFPGGYIPALSETVAASEKFRLIAADVEALRVHYARTIRQWYANCMANRDAIVALHDERFFRMWTFYLAGAATVFEHGSMCNYQIQYIRDRRALPLTRDWIAQEEKRLLAPAG